MGNGIVSAISIRTGETVKALHYRDATKRKEIIFNWQKQYGKDKIYVHIFPFANDRAVNNRGLNCYGQRIKKPIIEEVIIKKERPKAEYSNRTPFSILDEFTKPSQ